MRHVVPAMTAAFAAAMIGCRADESASARLRAATELAAPTDRHEPTTSADSVALYRGAIVFHSQLFPAVTHYFLCDVDPKVASAVQGALRAIAYQRTRVEASCRMWRAKGDLDTDDFATVDSVAFSRTEAIVYAQFQSSAPSWRERLHVVKASAEQREWRGQSIEIDGVALR